MPELQGTVELLAGFTEVPSMWKAQGPTPLEEASLVRALHALVADLSWVGAMTENDRKLLRKTAEVALACADLARGSFKATWVVRYSGLVEELQALLTQQPEAPKRKRRRFRRVHAVQQSVDVQGS